MKPDLPLVGLCALLLATGLAAQTPKVIKLNGSIYDTNGGPFKQGNIYLIVSNSSSCCGLVPDGKTLTIERGAIVKFQSNSLTVQGRLIARGAYFTSDKDDTLGGDTNGDGGKSKAVKGDWDRITFGGKGNGIVEDCTFRYGGSNGSMTIHIRNNESVVLNRCKIEEGGGDGLTAETSTGLKMTNCEIKSCEGIAVVGWALDRLENASNNRASGNKKGDYIRYNRRPSEVWPNPTITMARVHSMNGNGIFVLQVAPSLVAQVPKSHKLVIPAGSILKFMKNGLLTVSGNLQVGSGGPPVIFTSFHDDVGSDTNKSSQQPVPGDWQGIHFEQGSDASVVHNAVITYGGTSSDGAVRCSASAVTLSSTSVSWSKHHAVTVIPNAGSKPAFLNCTFVNNNGMAVLGTTWESVARSSGNQANNNAAGDYFQVQGHALAANVQVDIWPQNYPGGAVVLNGRTDFYSGSRLTFHAGTVVKVVANTGHSFGNATGMLECLGTARLPVVLTSLRDDSIGGDTNKDGTTTQPKAGDWGSLSINSRASGRFEHAIVRYGGGRGAAVATYSTSVLIAALRVEHSGTDGLQLSAYAKPLNNIVIYKAQRNGIIASSGTFDINHATVTGCGGLGISVGGGFQGMVQNSIAWNNGGGNYSGLTETRVQNSDGGFGGKNGNLNTDPRFVSASTGDLHLAANSPCLDKAGMAAALATKKDHEEFSRILDHALTGACLPDMGAYERSAYRLKVTGAAQLGQQMTFQIDGPAGSGKLFVGLLNGEVFLAPYGFALLGTFPIVQLSSGPVPSTVTKIVLPNQSSLLGARFGIQGIAVPSNKPLVGGVTDLCRFEVR